MAAQGQLVRDQHIVPRWHLRRFADVDGWFWRYRQNEPPKRCRPKGECWERDFYEYDVNGKRTHNRYERWLNRIENDAAPILDVLLNQRQLNQREMTVWGSYVASLFLRTQKVRSQFSSAMVQKFREQSRNPDFIRNLQYDLLKEGELVFADDLKKELERLRSNMENSPSFYHLSGLEQHTTSLGAALAAKTWYVLQAPPRKFFVISDCPVTTVEIAPGQARPGPGFAKESCVVILPITPTHIFVASSPAISWKPVGTPTSVDSTNLLVVRFADKRVYAPVNSSEIKILVDRELNQITFGKDAFVPAGQNEIHVSRPQPLLSREN